jgi:hypothetical protein
LRLYSFDILFYLKPQSIARRNLKVTQQLHKNGNSLRKRPAGRLQEQH